MSDQDMTDQERTEIAEAVTLNLFGEQGVAGARARKVGEIIISVIVALIGLAMIAFGAGFGYLVLILGAFMTIKYALKAPREYRVSPEIGDAVYSEPATSATNEPTGTPMDLSFGLGIGKADY